MFSDNNTMSDTPNTEVPAILNYDDTDIDRSVARPVLKDGWMKFIVTGAKTGLSKKGNPQFTLTVKPLDGNDIPKGPSTAIWVQVPFGVPMDAETQQKTLDRSREYLRATMNGELKRYPKWDKETSQFVDDVGNPLDKETANTLKKEAVRQCFGILQAEWADGGKGFVGDTFYAKVSKDGDFTRVQYFRASPPDDAEIITENFSA